MNHMNPAQILDVVVKTGQAKAGGTWKKLMLLGILAGAYIAFAGIASNTAAFNLLGEAETYGVGKVLSGTIFTGGLIMGCSCRWGTLYRKYVDFDRGIR